MTPKTIILDTETNTKTLYPPITPGGSVVSPEYVVRVSPKYTDNAYPQFADYVSAVAYLEGIVTSTQKGLIIIEEGNYSEISMVENICIIAYDPCQIFTLKIGDKPNNKIVRYTSCYINCKVQNLIIENNAMDIDCIIKEIETVQINKIERCKLKSNNIGSINLFDSITMLRIDVKHLLSEISTDASCILTDCYFNVDFCYVMSFAGTGNVIFDCNNGDQVHIGGSIDFTLNNSKYKFLSVSTACKVLLQHNIIDNSASHAISLADEAKLTIKDSWIRGNGGNNGAILCQANSNGRFIISSSYIHSTIYSIVSLRPNRQVWVYSPCSTNVPVDTNILIDGYPFYNLNTNFQWFN